MHLPKKELFTFEEFAKLNRSYTATMPEHIREMVLKAWLTRKGYVTNGVFWKKNNPTGREQPKTNRIGLPKKGR